MLRKNDFEKLCDEIENCNDMCESNPIICARHYVNKYTLKDKDRLLKLKAEARSIEYLSFMSLLISIISFVVATFTMYLEISKSEMVIAYVSIVTVGCLFGALWGRKQFGSVRKYQSYLLVVIDEELKQLDWKSR